MSPSPRAFRTAPPKGRDLRIDVARGLAMFTMLISHTRDQDLTRWLPNRWGFADAADVFVTLSGLVAGIVFTRIAVTQGWPAMTGRVLRRCRTIWLAQIGSVVGIALLALFIDRVLAGPLGLGHDYLSLWPVSPVLDRPVEAVLALGAMIWVPNNFDILPMYLVLLAFVPVWIGLYRLAGLPAVLLLIFTSYGLAHAGLNLPANPWNPGQKWYFNPFAWMLPFGIAFCFGAGWIAMPRVTGRRAALAAVFLVASLPLGFWAFRHGLWVPGWKDGLDAILTELQPLTTKSNHGVLRGMAVFAMLMLGAWAAGPAGRRLREGVSFGETGLPRGLEVAAGLVLVGAALMLADHWSWAAGRGAAADASLRVWGLARRGAVAVVSRRVAGASLGRAGCGTDGVRADCPDRAHQPRVFRGLRADRAPDGYVPRRDGRRHGAELRRRGDLLRRPRPGRGLVRQGTETGGGRSGLARRRRRQAWLRPARRRDRPVTDQKNACRPVWARPRMRAWTSWVPS